MGILNRIFQPQAYKVWQSEMRQWEVLQKPNEDALAERQMQQTNNPIFIPYSLQGDADNVVPLDEAYRIPAVWEAVSLISRSLARLPLYVVRPSTGDKVYNHSGLSRLYNIDQDSYLVRQTLFNNLVLHGECFAAISDTKLVPLKPGAVTRVTVNAEGNRLYYLANGRVATQAEIFHVIGSSLDGVRGLSPLVTNGLTMKLARAVDDYGQKFFTQRRPVATLNTQGDLDEETAEALARRYAHASTEYGVFVLDRNSTLQSLSGTPDEAQFNESRQSLVLAIARIFGVPPVKLGVMDYSTFNNITEENISFVRECLSNYAAPFEAAYQFWFNVEMHHDYTELLETSFEDRAAAVVSLVSSGLLTINEGRARLNYPNVSGGDELQVSEPNIEEEDSGMSDEPTGGESDS